MKKLLSIFFVLAVAGLAYAGDGGPDGGGYYWYDQDYDPNMFDEYWQDISSTGDWLAISTSDDSHQLAGTLSWDFNFYGDTYSNIYVGSNGTVYFQDTYLGFGNEEIPGDSGYGVNTFMAPWWTDLNPSSGGDIYFEDFGDYFIVMFDEVNEYYSGPIVATFLVIGWEAVDSDNSDIMFLYDFDGTDSYCTIGIQGDTSTGTGLEYNPSSVDSEDVYYFTMDDDPPPTNIQPASVGHIKAIFK